MSYARSTATAPYVPSSLGVRVKHGLCLARWWGQWLLRGAPFIEGRPLVLGEWHLDEATKHAVCDRCGYVLPSPVFDLPEVDA